jgi:hypothetical protein
MNERATDWVDEKIDRARRRYENHGKIFRTMWILVGVIVVLAGLAMIVVPGPVTIVVPAGLAMLAAVFGWARRLLLVSVQTGVAAKDRVAATSTWVKVLGGCALACLAAAGITLVILW